MSAEFLLPNMRILKVSEVQILVGLIWMQDHYTENNNNKKKINGEFMSKY